MQGAEQQAQEGTKQNQHHDVAIALRKNKCKANSSQ
jgi:hypothetical protein